MDQKSTNMSKKEINASKIRESATTESSFKPPMPQSQRGINNAIFNQWSVLKSDYMIKRFCLSRIAR